MRCAARGAACLSNGLRPGHARRRGPRRRITAGLERRGRLGQPSLFSGRRQPGDAASGNAAGQPRPINQTWPQGGTQLGTGGGSGTQLRGGALDRTPPTTVNRPITGGNFRPGDHTRPADQPGDPSGGQPNYNRNWFSKNWWANHAGHNQANWNYYQQQRPNYWWRAATWNGVTAWMPGTWGTPVFYNYGQNVVLDNNQVYVDGQQVGTTAQYADQARQLATAAPPVDPSAAQWMPLGVFALSSGRGDPGDNMALQLAVSKEGLVTGTFTNRVNDTASAVQGTIALDAQRVAWTVGVNRNPVFDTGVYNLTQDETPVLVHFGTQLTQTWRMTRLQAPEEAVE